MTLANQNKILIASFVSQSASKFQANLEPYGIDAQYTSLMDESINRAKKSQIDYVDLRNTLKELTRKQDYLIKEVKGGIYALKSLAKLIIKEANINDDFKTVKTTVNRFAAVVDEANQMIEMANKYQGTLDTNRFKKLDVLKSNLEELLIVNAKQELTKKEIGELKLIRKQTLQEIDEKRMYIQKIARVAFKGEPEKRKEFFKFIILKTNFGQENQETSNQSEESATQAVNQ